MQLDFFPSRTLTLYLARLFIVRVFGVLFMLVLVLQMLDLLSESGKILEFPGNGQAQLWTYVTLRAPQLVARFLPYSVLLATLITFVTLNQNSEVIAMKAAGLSAHQVLAPLFVTALLVAGLSFAFNERIVTRATATLKAWQSEKFCRERLGRNQPLGPIELARMNVKGGSIAVGHPFAATGARVIATMAKLLNQKGTGRGLVSVCTAGGMGVTAILEAAAKK